MSILEVQKKSENYKFDDSSLVKRCQQGDSAAMETLIIKYQDRIFNLTYKMCSNFEDASELTQDTFVKAIERINDFRGKSAFYTWIYRIAVNLTLNHCKRKVKIGFKSIDDTLKDVSSESRMQLKNFLQDNKELDPALIAQKRDIYELMLSALNSLDEDQKAVVILRDIESLSYKEISEITGVELGTVKSRLFRARDNLRDILKEVLK